MALDYCIDSLHPLWDRALAVAILLLRLRHRLRQQQQQQQQLAAVHVRLRPPPARRPCDLMRTWHGAARCAPPCAHLSGAVMVRARVAAAPAAAESGGPP